MVYLGYLAIEKLLEEGVCVSLGADAAAAGNTLSLFNEMRAAAIIHKGHAGDPTILPAERVLEMATVNGARALDWDSEIGSIEKGKRADIIIVDADQPHMTPLFDIVSNLVYSANGADVETVIVNGRVIMRERQVMTVQEEKILRKARELALGVLERNKIRVEQRFPCG